MPNTMKRRMWRLVALGMFSLITTVATVPTRLHAAAHNWIYVVSTDSNPGSGRITTVDPDAGRVLASLVRGFRPDLAASRDGTRLFISYDTQKIDITSGAFEVVSTADGSILFHRDEAESRGGMGGSYRTRMALANDGSRLFRFKSWTTDTSGTAYWIETFDVALNRFLPDRAPVPVCGEGTIRPSNQQDVVFVVCPESEDVRILNLTSSGALLNPKPQRVNLGAGTKQGFPPAAFFQDSGRTFTVVKPDGSLIRIDTQTGAVILREAIDRLRRQVPTPEEHPPVGHRVESTLPTDWLAGRSIHGGSVGISPDGSKLYLNVLGAGGGVIAVLDAVTFEQLRLIPYNSEYASFILSADGTQLYAVDRLRKRISVFDADSGRVLRSIELGFKPVFAVVSQ
jgi:hypothetical protein